MPKPRRIILVVVNAITLTMALIVIAVVSRKPALHSSDSSHSQLVAKVENISDIPRLRSLISRDDEYVRTLEDVISTSTASSRSVLILFAVFATFNLVLLFLPHHRKP